MERKKADATRVRLRSAHDSWQRQRESFVRGKQILSNYDEAFATHLLEKHALTCSDPSCNMTTPELSARTRCGEPSASAGARQLQHVEEMSQLQPWAQLQLSRTMPRLTPLKYR